MYFKVVMLHFTSKCNLSCPMCYRKTYYYEKGLNFWIDCVPYLSEITNQTAIGGGEPFLHPNYLRKLAAEFWDYGIIPNITTNGTQVERIKELQHLFGRIAISYDKHKYSDVYSYINILKKLDKNKLVCNYLLLDKTREDMRKEVPLILKYVSSINFLYPKNVLCKEVPLSIIKGFALLYGKRVTVDDTTYHLLTEGVEWKTPCHYGKDIININPDGSVTGCSFDPKPLLMLEKPSDILKLKYLETEERRECPFIRRC